MQDLLSRQPIVPFIREADFAVREPWHVGTRRLLDYLFIYIQEGHCIIQVEETEYHFQEGDFCLIQPNTLFTLRGITHTITPFAHMDLFYNPEREKSFPTRPGQVDVTAFHHLLQPRLNDYEGIDIPVKFFPAHPARFRETLLKMIGIWQNRDIMSQLEAQSLAMQLLLFLLQDYRHVSTLSSSQPQLLNWITSYLSFHLSESLSVEDMAKRANLSVSRFSVIFRGCFGLSPHQYLLHLRLQHAQELLKNEHLTLAQISQYCGFATVHHFSKAFKKAIGQTPGTYREAVRRPQA